MSKLQAVGTRGKENPHLRPTPKSQSQFRLAAPFKLIRARRVLEGLECSSAGSIVARIEPASRVAQRARKATKGRRGPGMLERSPIYLEPRWRRRKRRVAANKRVGGESRMVGPGKIRASRRSQVVETPGGSEKKKSISTLPAPRGGARCEAVRRVPTGSLLKRRTRAQIIIRRHGNARPIARLDVLCGFSFLSLTLCPLFPPPRSSLNPFQTTLVGPHRSVSFSPPSRTNGAHETVFFFSFWRSPARVHLPSLTLTGKTRQHEGSWIGRRR